MTRWIFLALSTSCILLVIAAAQGTPALLKTVAARSGWRITGLGAWGAPAAALVPAQPFAHTSAPAWSDTDALVARLQEQLAQMPDDALSAARYAQLGSLYLQKVRETGDPSYYPKAEGVLARSLQMALENPAAMVGMAGLALSRHDFAGGLEWGQRVLAKTPGSYVAWGVVADAYTELGRYDDAVDALQKMVDLRPDQISLSRVSYARELHGDVSGAIEAMRQAADAGAPRSEGTAWTRIQLANLLFNSNDYDAADLQLRYVLNLLPDYVHGVAGMAKLAAARGDLPTAANLYAKALDAFPSPEYAIALAEVERAQGHEAAAGRADDLVRAIAQLQRAAGVDVDLEMALFEADHAAGVSTLADAVQNARAIYARRPSVHAADVLAWTLYRAGRVDEALPYAHEALRLGSRDPLMLFHAGAIVAAAGQFAEARGYLEAALVQNPHFSVRYAPEAQKLLAKVSAR